MVVLCCFVGFFCLFVVTENIIIILSFYLFPLVTLRADFCSKSNAATDYTQCTTLHINNEKENNNKNQRSKNQAWREWRTSF